MLRYTYIAHLVSFYSMVCQYADKTMKKTKMLTDAVSHIDCEVSICIIPSVLHQP